MTREPSVIIHIPHSSRFVPPDIRESFVLTDAELQTELIRMTDSFTDELFLCDTSLAYRIIYPVSRLVVDPERFVDDIDEPMSKEGMGAVYEKTSQGKPLRKNIIQSERQSLIEKYYKPHHVLFTGIAKKVLGTCGHVLIIDCHSFPSVPLEYESDKSPDRPDICIGTDSYHTPQWLIDSAVGLLDNQFTIKINHPFSGAIVPMSYYCTEKRVVSIMLEINRSLYMDEASGLKNDGFKPLQEKIRQLLESLISSVNTSSRLRGE
jgi:N-formylglutamate amidohydrolase